MTEKQQLKYAFGSTIFVHTEVVFLLPGIIRNLFVIIMDSKKFISLFLSNSFRHRLHVISYKD